MSEEGLADGELVEAELAEEGFTGAAPTAADGIRPAACASAADNSPEFMRKIVQTILCLMMVLGSTVHAADPTTSATDAQQINQWAEQLGSADPQQQQQATQGLEDLSTDDLSSLQATAAQT